MNTVLAGTTVPLVLRVVDDNTPANNPVTGLSAVVAIRRIGDDKWFDFIAGEWDTVADWGSLGAEHKQPLTDKGDGSYAYVWNQAAADSSAERTYEMTYAVTAGVGYVGRQAGEEWRFAVDYTVAGDEMDLVDAPNATAVTALQAGLATATNLATLAAQFTGITSLANWLRALARKDTADATALSEINTGGGAYDAATDSLEAIRNTEPLGTPMRGTDGAYTGTPPTVEQIQSGLSTFNPTTDEVDVGSVKGVAVTSVDDFKADVSGLSTFNPATDEVDVGSVKGSAVSGVSDFKADISGLSTLTAQQVWEYGARTLSEFGFTVALTAGHGLALASDLTTLVGKFTGITLVADWFRALIRKDAANATAKSEINSGGGTYDETTDSLEAIRDTEPLGTAMRGTDGAYTGTPPTVEQIAGAVWDEAQADHLTAGSTGKSLSDARSAGDPWATDVPGDYEEGTAGHRIGVLLTGGGGITLQAASPTVVVDASGEVVGGDGRLVAVRGCTHAVTWERAGSDFTGHTIVLTCRDELEEADDDDDSEAAFTLDAVVVSATQFTTTLTPTHTDELTVGQAYWYQIKDLTANENLLNRGRLEVVQSVVKRTA